MATPRKHWFRVADSVLYEPWTDAQLATMIRLCAYLNTRWARNGLTPEEAGRADLPLGALRVIAQRTHRADCERALRALEALVSMHVERSPSGLLISWPKFAEFQGFVTRESPESFPRVALESPSPTPTPPLPRKRREDEEAAAPPASPEIVEPKKPPRQQRPKLEHPPAPPKAEEPRLADLGAWLEHTMPERCLAADRIEKLRAKRPGGTLYGTGAVQAWWVATAPKIAERGYANDWLAAQRWWPRVQPHEIEACVRYCEQLAAEVYEANRSAEIREPPQFSAEEIADTHAWLSRRSVGGTQ